METEKEMIERMQKGNELIQKLIRGEGSGVVFVIFKEGGVSAPHVSFSTIRMRFSEAIGHIDIIKTQLSLKMLNEKYK